ncbi:MAG TPA: winged helix-turn-helix domain-containing protein [Aliidongia sp.]|nr:winged helix-turn-helix domain-containing protein [Aliidongia sp.]
MGQDYLFGTFRLLPERRRLLCDEIPVQLSPRAISILIALVERHDRVVTKDEIFAEVWPGTFVEENNLTVHVSALRKVLGPGAITTIPGRGYRFTAELAAAAELAPRPKRSVRQAAPPRATNLPQRLAALVGREIELDELPGRLAQDRLVTLTGPSGIGKTRLAIELGWRLMDSFPDGVWLVGLAEVSDPAAVTGVTATVLGVGLLEGQAPVETLAAALGGKLLLLIFDNCEHLIGPAANLIEALTDRVPGLAVLATSQETLRLAGEQVYRLDPLALPPPAATKISEFGAVALFVDRARAADRYFKLDEDSGPSVVEICRHLDGIPLALEMAAARLPLLGLDGLRAGLDERFLMLSSCPRTAEGRHRTLRDTVAWSYSLLDAADQCIFRRLSAFRGSFSLDAAIAVAGEVADRWETVDAIGRLVDKSLVTAEGGEQPRYRLLETLRLYASERLAEAGQTGRVAERHAQFFADLFDRAYEVRETTPDTAWLKLYRPELDNVRSALDWALADVARAEIAIALAGSAAQLWYRLSLFPEGRRYADAAAMLVPIDQPSSIYARLLREVGRLWYTSDRWRGIISYQRSAEIYRQLGDAANQATMLCRVGDLLVALGRHAEAETTLLEAQKIMESASEKSSPLEFYIVLGFYYHNAGTPLKARDFFLRALELTKRGGSFLWRLRVLSNLAEVELSLGNIERAVELGQEVVSSVRAMDRPLRLGICLINLASYLVGHHRPLEARQAAREGFLLVREEGGPPLSACLQLWALLIAIAGRGREAAKIGGFVDKDYLATGEWRQPTERMIYERLMDRLNSTLSAADLAECVDEGASWSEEEAVAFVQREI